MSLPCRKLLLISISLVALPAFASLVPTSQHLMNVLRIRKLKFVCHVSFRNSLIFKCRKSCVFVCFSPRLRWSNTSFSQWYKRLLIITDSWCHLLSQKKLTNFYATANMPSRSLFIRRVRQVAWMSLLSDFQVPGNLAIKINHERVPQGSLKWRQMRVAARIYSTKKC